VWSADFAVTLDAQRIRPQVVGQEKHDVQLRRLGGARADGDQAED
jgi:hypothetical protein